MKVTKRINNNAVMCVDSRGRSVVAFGKGIAFAIDKETADLPLVAIERTFYNIDKHYLALLDELTPAVLDVSADIIEAASVELPYELSPNASIALADHISFALKRSKKGMSISMPLAYDVAQMYPHEYHAAEYALKLIDDRLHVELPQSEIAGIAICLFNTAIKSADDADARSLDSADDDAYVNAIAEMIEGRYDITVDRHGFEYARFATHVHYLLRRVRTGEPFAGDDSGLYETARMGSKRGAAVLDEAVALLERELGATITEGEKLYLLMHIMRVAHPRH